MVTLYFLYFCTDYLGLNSAIVGTIFLVTKLFDGVSDLVMGSIIDRTKSKMGKARVWILRGCIPYGIASILLFTIPTSVPSAVTYVYVFVAYNLVNTITFTCCCLSVNTLNCLLTQNAYERGILGIFNMFGTVAGQTVINTFTLKMLDAFGNDRKAWVIVVAIYAVISIVLQLLCVRGVTERVTLYGEEAEKKETVSVMDSLKALLHNKYWIMFTVVYTLIQIYAAVFMASLVYYCTVCMGNANYMSSLANGVTIFQLIALMLSFILIKRFGKAKTFNIGVVGMLVIMAFYKLDKEYPQIIKELEERKKNQNVTEEG